MTPDQIEAAIRRFGSARVAVVGDLMMDEYVWGDVVRISPDAPVQVVEIRRRSHAIGGAGNVAHNIAAAGGRASLFGVVGSDAAGGALVDLLRETGVDTSGIVTETGRPTTVKTRVVARGQHLVRLDEETREPLRVETRAGLLGRFERALAECDLVLVSDYAKGVVDERFVADLSERTSRAHRVVPVVVDPKASDFGRYRGCTAITPNHKEAEIATGLTIGSDRDIAAVAVAIRTRCGAEWILITRGDRGMALSGPSGAVDLIPARAREVYDVTGAGDTALAYFGLGLCAGLSAPEAALLSNVAAGIAVGKVGTTPVTPSEILAEDLGARPGPRKLLDRREAATRIAHERSLGRRIVFTNGCFDLLHAGHVHLLERAREMGDFLVVAINTDASVRRLKGEGRPLVSEPDRAKVLSALDAVDLVLLFDEDTPLEVIKLVRPDVLVKGGDYTTETIVGHELVLGYGGRVVTVPLLGGRSTTDLIAGIRGARRGSDR